MLATGVCWNDNLSDDAFMVMCGDLSFQFLNEIFSIARKIWNGLYLKLLSFVLMKFNLTCSLVRKKTCK